MEAASSSRKFVTANKAVRRQFLEKVILISMYLFLHPVPLMHVTALLRIISLIILLSFQ